MADGRYIVAFENVSATVGGFDISSILELQLSASANGVPTVTLVVDAGHTGAAKTSMVGDKVTISEIRKFYDAMRPLVKTSAATLSLSLTARAVGGGDDVQTLNITGWMLTDIAASPIQYRGVSSLSLTFMHPLCKADFGGAVPGLLASAPDFSGLKGGDPLSTFADALRVYGDQVNRESSSGQQIPGMAPPDAVRSNLLRRLQQASAALTGALSWKGPNKLPAENVVAVWQEFIAKGIAYYAMPSGGSSVLARFLRSCVPECSLAVGGDYTAEKLEVSPFVPWTSSSLSIDDSDITDMQFPSQDPDPMSGVRVESMETSFDLPTSQNIKACQLTMARNDNYYIPQSELSAEFLYGPIQQFSEPGWLQHALGHMNDAMAASESDTVSANTGSYQDPRTVPRDEGVAVASADDTTKINYGYAILACAKAYFETSVMKDWAFEVGARFIVKSGGGILCPGRVLAVRSNGTEVLAGYVTNVTHNISVAGRTAKTTITCTHPRFGAPPFGISGSGNALYS